MNEKFGGDKTYFAPDEPPVGGIDSGQPLDDVEEETTVQDKESTQAEVEVREIEMPGELGEIYKEVREYQAHVDQMWKTENQAQALAKQSRYYHLRKKIEEAADPEILDQYINYMREITDGLYPSLNMLCRYVPKEGRKDEIGDKDHGGYFSPMLAWNPFNPNLYVIGRHNAEFRKIANRIAENFDPEKIPLNDLENGNVKFFGAQQEIFRKLVEIESPDKGLVGSIDNFVANGRQVYRPDYNEIIAYALMHDIPIIGSPEDGILFSWSRREKSLHDVAEVIIDFQNGKVKLQKS